MANMGYLCYTICMENKYVHARTCVYNINYHIIWCVKYRKKVLIPEISNRLYEIIQDIAKDKGFDVVECKTGESDHVHCFVSAPPKILESLYGRDSYGMDPIFVRLSVLHLKIIFLNI